MDVFLKIQEIEVKLKAMQQKSLILETENAQLHSKLAELRAEIEHKNETIINLEEQNKIAKLAEGLSKPDGNESLKQQLDELISEIDRCINLVKR